jgi:hypothetical protein
MILLPVLSMPLFKSPPFTDDTPMRYAERMFAFLNRSGRPHVERVRRAMEQWFQRYPTSEQRALKRRLETDFDPPAFELVLHELLCQAHYDVDVEPEAVSRSTRPDFHAVRRPEGTTVAESHLPATEAAGFYLEAIVSTDTTAEDRKRAAVERAIWDAINAHPSPDYWLRLRKFDLRSDQQPTAKHIKAFLNKAYKSTSWVEALAALKLGGIEEVPRVVFSDTTLHAEFDLIPKSAAARGAGHARSIGMTPVRVSCGDAVLALRGAFTAKAEKYGDLGAPFVIAINSVNEFGTERYEIEQALYGFEELSPDESEGHPLAVRIGPAPDPRGMFDPTRPDRFKRVSAVITGTMHVTALGESTMTVYHNPWAMRPLAADALPLSQVTLVQDSAGARFVRTSGLSLARAMQLPDGWPHGAEET